MGNRRLHVRRKVSEGADLNLSVDVMLHGYIIRQAEIKGSHLKRQVFRKVSHAESTSSHTFYVISRSFLKRPCQQTSEERVANRFGIKTLSVVLSSLTKQLNTKTYPKKVFIVLLLSKTLFNIQFTSCHSYQREKKIIFCFISCLTTHSVIYHKKDKQGTELKFTWKPDQQPTFQVILTQLSRIQAVAQKSSLPAKINRWRVTETH